MEFKIPHLHRNWPFPCRKNPFFNKESQLSNNWLDSYQLFDGASQIKFRDIKSGTLAAFAYPDLSKDHFRVACDFLNILYAMDDISDQMSAADARSLTNAVLDVIRSDNEPTTQEQHKLFSIHKSFWRNMNSIASNTVRKRFITNYEAYINSIVQEAMERRDHQLRLSFEEYLVLGRVTGAIRPALDLIMLPLEISEEYLELRSVKELEMIAIDLIAIANDVVSFNVEQARGDIHNIIILLMEKRNLSVQEAMDLMDEWYQKRSSQFIDLMKETEALLDDANHIQRDLKTYIRGLAHWVTANYEWSFETNRFFGTLSKKIYTVRTVSLMPKKGIKGRILANINSTASKL